MSRTYRRRRYRQMFRSDDPLTDFWAYDEDIIWEDVETIKYSWDFGFLVTPRYNVRYRADTDTGRKLIARARSDAATNTCKEPGPHWFRNLYSDRPLRRKAKEELRKFKLSLEGPIRYYNFHDEAWDWIELYEPMIDLKGKLPYWT